MEDFVFYIGSAKQASDYVNTAEYLINFIKKTYDDGNDIADALSEERDFPMKTVEPKLEVSSEKDDTKKSVEDRQNELKYNKRLYLFIKRERVYEKINTKAYAFFWERCSKAMKNKL